MKHFLQSLGLGLLITATQSLAAVDPNFHIYLAFGQSNMEGQGIISSSDRTVDSRFQHLPAVSCSNLGKTKGTWTTATPPLARCYTNLSPMDNFGKTMVAGLPSNIKVGVVMVAVAGCKIELFDKVNYQSYVNTAPSYMTGAINDYGGNPYARLVEMGLLAKQSGVIKGIMLHQGESNTNDAQWARKVRDVYNNLLTDLGLQASEVPLLAGQVVDAAQQGQCASMNAVIDTLPRLIPTAHIISSAGCTDTTDNLHFNSAGYRELGKRYATKMLSLVSTTPVTPPREVSRWFEAECTTVGSSWEIVADASRSNGHYLQVKTGKTSTTVAPTGAADILEYSFTVDTAGSYTVFGLVNNANGDDDSFYFKMNNGSFESVSQLQTTGWQWKTIKSYPLTAGNHKLTIAYREDGAKLDKIGVSNLSTLPTGMGGTATGCQIPVAIHSTSTNTAFDIHMNHGQRNIVMQVPHESMITVKLHSLLGQEIAVLANQKFPAGTYTLDLNNRTASPGIYVIKMQAGSFNISQKIQVQ